MRQCEMCSSSCDNDFRRCKTCINEDPEVKAADTFIRKAFEFNRFKKKRHQKKHYRKWMFSISDLIKDTELDWQEWKSWKKTRYTNENVFKFPVPFVWEKTSYEYDEWDSKPLHFSLTNGYLHAFLKFYNPSSEEALQ
ncbi:MAG: hypothetical protein NE330_15115 [Lentisphaeraceae bacterium]|nr:hypothetical protein [Lentisphaeraceae bacterium]